MLEPLYKTKAAVVNCQSLEVYFISSLNSFSASIVPALFVFSRTEMYLNLTMKYLGFRSNVRLKAAKNCFWISFKFKMRRMRPIYVQAKTREKQLNAKFYTSTVTEILEKLWVQSKYIKRIVFNLSKVWLLNLLYCGAKFMQLYNLEVNCFI